MNGYLAGNAWSKFVRTNGRQIRPAHVALMYACYQIANEENWTDEFQLPTKEAMELSCIRDKETFYNTLKDLVSFGAISVLQESKNIYTARWVTFENLPFYLSEIPTTTPTGIPLAIPTGIPTTEPIGIPTGTLPNTKSKETKESNKSKEDTKVSVPDPDFEENEERKKRAVFKPPTAEEIEFYLIGNYQCSIQAAKEFTHKFWSHYNSNGWKVGKVKMVSWQSAISGTWKETRENIFLKYPQGVNSAPQRRKYLNDPSPV